MSDDPAFVHIPAVAIVTAQALVCRAGFGRGLPLRLFDQQASDGSAKRFHCESLSHHDAVFCDL